ncbi:MAG: hypothetical protein JAY60_20110 [Candidatus Thiodiazotropha weberae]|nr:hypothetical protein [Candidatus Thiodiazotropha weberae]
MGLFDPVAQVDSDFETWIREVINHIYPTWHGYTFDLDSLDVKGLPYYEKGVSPEVAAAALLHDCSLRVSVYDASMSELAFVMTKPDWALLGISIGVPIKVTVPATY